jgi:hypothetical protein
MEQDHVICEVFGILKFMVFLSRRLGEREYQLICDLHTEYLDEQLVDHIVKSVVKS